MGLKTVTAAGRLVRDPESKQTQTGMDICHFTIAVDSNRPQKGEEKPKSSFFRVTCFGKKAIVCQKFLGKGDEVIVAGDIELDTYQGQDGKQYSNMQITANEVHFGRKANKGESAPKKTESSRGDYDQGYAAANDPAFF